MTVDTTSIPTPAVPPIVRTVAYFVLLAISAAVLISTGLATIWLAPEIAAKIVASGGVVTSALGVIAGGLGVAYRPTAAAPTTSLGTAYVTIAPAPATQGEVVDDGQDGTTEGTEGLPAEDATE